MRHSPRLTIEDLSEELLGPDPEGEAKDYLYLVSLNEDAARAFFESTRWPRGPSCPSCRKKDIYPLRHPAQEGQYGCERCEKRFNVKMGTLLEGSQVPLKKWLLATYLLACSSRRLSALQLARIVDLHYETAWRVARKIGCAIGFTRAMDSPAPCNNVQAALERLMRAMPAQR